MEETPIEMARRHVRQGQALINQQQMLIDDMIADGYHALLPQVRAALAILQEAQMVNEQHLAELEGTVLRTC